ncbi:MAG: 16S rRNA (guanine(966)-N(2))-methyltransferase RsmD [Magnetococcales bacterium]|nr:16S rRNA (guanine(966)-N(2))-methyltransferase RsmD [Magnetococcales bacterium]
MLKISGGSCRGRILRTGTDKRIRPTTGRVKEALFSMLGSRVSQAVVLDLFAGSGSLGLEALSRGAAAAIFVDNHRQSLSLIKENIKQCGFIDKSEVVSGSALQSRLYNTLEQQLKKNSWQHEGFNLVFLDPPYGQGMAQSAINNLTASTLLLVDAVVVTEEAENVIVTLPEDWTLLQSRSYKDTRLHIWSRQNNL